MRIRKVALLFLSVPLVILAADPFVGTWKLNLSKSHYTTGTPPKEQTAPHQASFGSAAHDH